MSTSTTRRSASARGILYPGNRQIVELIDAYPGWSDRREVVRRNWNTRRRLRDLLVERGYRLGVDRRQHDTEHAIRAGRRTPCLVKSRALAGSESPVPAMSATSPGRLLRQASTNATRSPSSSRQGSPVVPATTTAATPRSTSLAACSAVSDTRRRSSLSNSETRATATPSKTGSVITPLAIVTMRSHAGEPAYPVPATAMGAVRTALRSQYRYGDSNPGFRAENPCGLVTAHISA